MLVTTLTASNPATTSGRILLKLCSFTRIVAPFLFPLMLKWRVVMLWVDGRFHVHNIATICAARSTGTVTELLLLPTVAAPEPLLFLLGSNHLSRPENPAATVLP